MKWFGLIVTGLCTVVAPVTAAAQVSVQGGVGVNVNSGGNNQSISVGFWPGDRVGLLLGVERVHEPTVVEQFDNVTSTTRGGTTRFVSGEIRWLLRSPDRAAPYLLAGGGGGRSRPNVNETFPDPVVNTATVIFGGGGFQAPFGGGLSVFADLRFMFHVERDSLLLLVPLRGGVGWRF